MAATIVTGRWLDSSSYDFCASDTGQSSATAGGVNHQLGAVPSGTVAAEIGLY